MTRWLPETLFARLALLLLAALATAIVTTVLLFREDRAALVARSFTDTRLEQIEALRDALRALPDEGATAPPDRAHAGHAGAGGPGAGPGRAGPLAQFGAGWLDVQRRAREAGFVLIPAERRPEIGALPRGPAFQKLRTRLAERLGAEVDVRLGMRLDQPIAWLRLPVGREGTRSVWLGVPIRAAERGELPRTLIAALALTLALVLAFTWWFTRRLTQPLADLSKAMEAVASGRHPAPLPETGPREIAEVAKNVNRMAAALDQLETNRSVMLAGISHDLRTPLTRLRLATELAVGSDEERRAMIADIEDIERVLGQFLDFARGTPPATAREVADLVRAVADWVERERARGREILFTPPPEVVSAGIHRAAFERLLANLVDNAFTHGAPPVAIELSRRDGEVVLDVLDRGPGIDPARAEALKAPFVRGDAARSGPPGAGLGLAIVEQLAAWHDARFELLPRSGGGTVARLRLPGVPATRQ
jgi:two-component system osmolarity sensor histidine kinase EnvZ